MCADTVEAFAPAKINLTLHVTGQRADGYHLLESLVVFADVGDRVSCSAAAETTLCVTGPRAAGIPTDAANLVLQAKQAFAPELDAEIILEKHLPAAAGIGGGSSDAAACLRAMAEVFALDLPAPQAAARIGADLPVCLLARPCRMSGIGEALAPVPPLPPLHLVLANPGVAVATPQVFQGLAQRQNRPMPAELPEWRDAPGLARWLATQRNDLERPARALAPVIGVALMRLGQTDGCLLARMSGSGATCFGLFETRVEADQAADDIAAVHPDWWVRSASSWTRA